MNTKENQIAGAAFVKLCLNIAMCIGLIIGIAMICTNIVILGIIGTLMMFASSTYLLVALVSSFVHLMYTLSKIEGDCTYFDAEERIWLARIDRIGAWLNRNKKTS